MPAHFPGGHPPIPASVVTDSSLRNALEEFRSTFGNEPTATGLASRLTCSELDTVAALLAAAGAPGAARTWLEKHSDDDSHHGILEEHRTDIEPPPWAVVGGLSDRDQPCTPPRRATLRLLRRPPRSTQPDDE